MKFSWLMLAGIATGLAWAALAAPAAAQEGDVPSVDEIVAKTNHMAYYQGASGRARVKMTITDAQGRERTKEFTILRKNMDDQDQMQRFYVYFHAPADERGTVFMVHKFVDKDDDRWLYMPALDVVKRIAASDERTSFVGSHFFYEDVSGRGTDEDHHELVETTDTYYVLKHTPKDPDSVEFDSYTMYIHKDTFIPVLIQYEKGGEVYRESKALAVEEIQGYKTVTRSIMSDTKQGGQTMLEYTSVTYDIDLPEDLFTERRLRNAPMEHLQD